MTARLYDWTDVRWGKGRYSRHDDKPIVYRSIREARRNMCDAGACMDRLSHASYEIEIVTAAGEAIQVSETVTAHVEYENRRESFRQSIGQRIRRGETVVA